VNATKRLPTLYIPHGGGPCFFMDPPPNHPHMWDGLAAYLRGIDASLSVRPKAVLVVSGHWEMQQPTVNIAERPKLLFDYYGFPEHTYRLKYPVPGAPDLEPRVRSLLADAGFELGVDSKRGLDHGVFVPFLLIYPRADVPIMQLSLQQSLDPGLHLDIGRALAPLRDRGVLIVGSGMSYHNLAAMFSGRGGEVAAAFDAWLGDAVRDPQTRDAKLKAWRSAPGGRESHPREEHLLPLMVAAGAADGDAGVRSFGESIAGKAISGFQFG
jgi:aromatic ring-opening dioxygenase catalytic subunit (LigB family)